MLPCVFRYFKSLPPYLRYNNRPFIPETEKKSYKYSANIYQTKRRHILWRRQSSVTKVRMSNHTSMLELWNNFLWPSYITSIKTVLHFGEWFRPLSEVVQQTLFLHISLLCLSLSFKLLLITRQRRRSFVDWTALLFRDNSQKLTDDLIKTVAFSVYF